MPGLVSFFKDSFWAVVISIIGSVVFLWLALLSGSRYSVEDTEAHSSDYGEVIKEGHGGMTVFLWISFAGLFIWTIVYFVLNWEQFLVIFTVS